MKINREKLKNVIHEVFREHLNECESLITERWSYSDDMDNAIDHAWQSSKGCNLEYRAAKIYDKEIYEYDKL